MKRAPKAGRWLPLALGAFGLLGLLALLGGELLQWVRFWLSALRGMWLWMQAWPGMVWWTLVVALFALFALRTWLSAQPPSHPKRPGVRTQGSNAECPPGPITRYAELVRQAEAGRLLRRNLRRELARVAADRLALHENLPNDIAWKRVQAGAWPAPPAVREFLKRGEALPTLSLKERLRQAIQPSRDEEFRKELEEAIAFLERYGTS